MNIKRAVLIGTLSAIAIGLIAIGIKTKSFDIKKKTTTPIHTTQVTKSYKTKANPSQTITNVTNTKWKITNANCNAGLMIKSITGKVTNSDTQSKINQNIVIMAVGYTYTLPNFTPTANKILVNDTPTYLAVNDEIYITGGNDTTDANFIAWLISNATFVINANDVENGNFLSLQALMLQILTMPFTFITQAFNVTLWPNTPYAFNISNFILSLIAIASILFIIKLFTSGFSIVGNYTNNEIKRQNIKADKRNAKQAEKATKASQKAVKSQDKE